ncbi:hypothetical protein [Nonomuraea sp. SBT364]|uniref:hypothetical protein n=1 Tax=Nonomuraea sp. SBT364 TaxID=1580530 RepID=UPI00066CEF6F|nr:hypothetical protein [Nonomuraea sp. SBT364]
MTAVSRVRVSAWPVRVVAAVVGVVVGAVMAAVELDRRLRAAASPVRSLLAHPGMARTDLSREAPPSARLAGAVMGLLYSRPIDDAVTPILYAATQATAPPGLHIGPGRPLRKARPTFETLTGPAADTDLAVRLWSRSAQLTGVDILPASSHR